MEGIRERYEELYREWADCMTPWDELTETQKVFWLRLFARLDNEEREKRKVYETLGRVITLNPDLLPVVES